MTDSLKHIGSTLRSAREAKGLELKDIAEISKIRRVYLDAIENGDPAELPGLVYFEGYLKNYARLLGLDECALIGDYQESIEKTCEVNAADTKTEESEKKPTKMPAYKKRNTSLLNYFSFPKNK